MGVDGTRGQGFSSLPGKSVARTYGLPSINYALLGLWWLVILGYLAFQVSLFRPSIWAVYHIRMWC